MKTGLAVAGLLLAMLAAVVGCGAFGMGLTFIEPPHPSWSFPLPAAAGGPPQLSPSLSAGRYEVWVPKGAACTLHVYAPDGSAVGLSSSADECRISGDAKAGETWRIEAHGSGPPRSVYFGKDEAVFPRPLRLVALAALAAFVLGGGLVFGSFFVPTAPRAAAKGNEDAH